MCNNLIFNKIMILSASYVCLHAFSLHQESLDLDPGRLTSHFFGGSITLTQPKMVKPGLSSHRAQPCSSPPDMDPC
jgi:hypothetical protein